MSDFQREPWHIRWYNYNKYTIPVIFTVIGTLIFTVFLDFRTGDINFESHITAINMLTNRYVGFYLFAIYLIAIVQLANSLSFSKKRSPFGLAFFTLLNLTQFLLVYKYITAFYEEVKLRTDGFVIPDSGYFSINVMIAGSIFFLLATIFAWFYVDWKYVKIEE